MLSEVMRVLLSDHHDFSSISSSTRLTLLALSARTVVV